MKIAGLMPLKLQGKPDFQAEERMREFCDVMIVLFDNCYRADVYSGDADEHICTYHKTGWHDASNRLTLLSRALAHGATHALWCDDDELIEPKVSPKDIREMIREMESRGCELLTMAVRDIWTTEPLKYRADGIYGKKRRCVIQKLPFNSQVISWRGDLRQPLHQFPLQCGDVMDTDFQLLHYGMSTPQLRAARYAKYKKLDADNKCQPCGYEYLLNETGIELKDI